MRTKIVILVLALALGGLAAVMAARYLGDARSEIVADSEPIEVLIAQEDIPRGMPAEELLAKDMIVLEEVPARYVAAGAVSSDKALEGKVLAQPLTAGEQVTQSRFELPSAAGLAYSIPADYIALSIRVDEVTGVSGLLKPGDHVALLAHFDMGPTGEADTGPTAEAISRMLIRDVKVLAVGGSIRQIEDPTDDESEGSGVLATSRNNQSDENLDARTVTIAVSGAAAERIVFAQQEGEIWCALLPATGEELPKTPGSTLQTVFE